MDNSDLHHVSDAASPKSPKIVQRQMSGILNRFMLSTSKHTKTMPDSSGDSGDTCNRLTDDEGASEMDGGAVVGHFAPGAGSIALSSLVGSPHGHHVMDRSRRSTLDSADSHAHSLTSPSPPKFLAPIAKLPSSVFASSRNLLASAVPAARRRHSSEGSVSGFSTQTPGGGSSVVYEEDEEKEDYPTKQARLQRLADDLHKCGELEMAVDAWKDSLHLAEEHRDSLSNRTEIMCILMDLYFQLSQKARNNSDGYDDEEEKVDAINPKPQLRRPLSTNSLQSLSVSLHSTITLDDRSQLRSPAYYEQQAKRYVHRIKPALVKPAWIGGSTPLLNFLSRAEAWELALVVADKLVSERSLRGEPAVQPHQLATLHFQIASQKLDTHRQGEALQHLQATVKSLQQVPIAKRDMMMYIQVLELLANEYQQQGSPSLALEAYEEELRHAPADKQAYICCRMAELYIGAGELDMALEKLESAARKMDNDGDTGVIRLQLLQTKGDVLYRLGRMDASMLVYQQALNEAKSPADKAKLLYTMGRLCIRLRRTREAISFFTRELEITRQELGVNHLSVSHIYHELAKLYDEGLGEHKMALMKYNKALQIELAVLQECHYAVATCQRCNPIAHRMCEPHSTMHTQVTSQIRETKKCQGRMHFKLGDFDKALRTSFFNEQAPTGNGRRRAHLAHPIR
jgi:tetratricopeptide (TPR) repeat protein